MYLVWATDEFRLLGKSYPGFPILVDREMYGVDSANKFLRHHLLERGRVGSRKSWRTYGQHIYDFFSFLESHGLSWRPLPGLTEPSVIAAYRNFASDCGNSPRTINQRLSTVVQFYVFAQRSGWIDALPFTFESVRVTRPIGFLGHLSSSAGRTKSPTVMLRAPAALQSFLTLNQVRLLLSHVRNPTHLLMLRLGLQVGLRREEIATFPEAYVVNSTAPSSHMCQVRLDPRDGHGIKTKGQKARNVWMPTSLMNALWHYKLHIRPSRLRRDRGEFPMLFLTDRGLPWADDGRGLLTLLNEAGRKVGFRVGPHMLRHTYATHTLAALQGKRQGIDPLVFLQGQLGHSSINTTAIYLHLIGDLVEKAVTDYDDEVSKWSARDA